MKRSYEAHHYVNISILLLIPPPWVQYSTQKFIFAYNFHGKELQTVLHS